MTGIKVIRRVIEKCAMSGFGKAFETVHAWVAWALGVAFEMIRAEKCGWVDLKFHVFIKL